MTGSKQLERNSKLRPLEGDGGSLTSRNTAERRTRQKRGYAPRLAAHTPSAGLTPGSAARSAAVSVPPGTRASPPQLPPYPAPRSRFRGVGASRARS
ncbi:unnamed protein product, partial [Gulo gulo]